MNPNNVRTFYSDDINALLASVLYDIAGSPIPHGNEVRLAEIREAVAKRNATGDMISDIFRLIPVH